MIQDIHMQLNPELALQNQLSTKRLFTLELDWNSREKSSIALYGAKT
jgi:hypothetical protein